MVVGRLACPSWGRAEVRYTVPTLSLKCREQLRSRDGPSRPGHVWARQRGRQHGTPWAEAAAGGVGDSSSSAAEDCVQRSKRLVEEQQQLQLQRNVQIYDITKTRRMVESAMLAAVTGLAYTLATLLKLEGYMGYFLPLPVIISALRSGRRAALKTTATAFLLLFILMGPVKALTYLLIYGLLSLSLGCCWTAKLPWVFCIPFAAAVRVGGYLAYVKLASWVAHEDLMALIITNVHSMLDQLSSTIGASGAPSLLAVTITIGSILLVNSLVYVAMMHVLFAILLRGMGLEISPMPAAVHKFVFRGMPLPQPSQ